MGEPTSPEATKAREKPMPFCAEMVRALLADRKTVTRRVVNRKKVRWRFYCDHCDSDNLVDYHGMGTFICRACGKPCPGVFKPIPECAPYQAGDVLWVREALRRGLHGETLYAADGVEVGKWVHGRFWEPLRWRWTKANRYKRDRDFLPSIFMPKEACRLWLPVISCTPERLQDITDEEIEAEGMGFVCEETNLFPAVQTMRVPFNRVSFQMFWDRLNAKRGYPWDANDYVWRTEFEGAKT